MKKGLPSEIDPGWMVQEAGGSGKTDRRAGTADRAAVEAGAGCLGHVGCGAGGAQPGDEADDLPDLGRARGEQFGGVDRGFGPGAPS